MGKILCIGLAVMLCCASPAAAEMTTAEFLNDVNIKVHRVNQITYLMGISNGLQWYNSILEAGAKEKDIDDMRLFCPPAKLSITASQEIDMLRRYIREHPEAETQPLGMVVFQTHFENFPCK